MVRLKAAVTTVLAVLLLAAFFSIIANSIPQGPDTITTASSQSRATTPAATVNAQAGNVTGLTISSIRATDHWQGFYGNITGSVVLYDASNNTLFDWSIANPHGEVYAANSSSVVWSDVKCANLTNNGSETSTGHRYNATKLERFFNINSTEHDGIDETFNQTYSNDTGFMVGPSLITNNCPLLTT